LDPKQSDTTQFTTDFLLEFHESLIIGRHIRMIPSERKCASQSDSQSRNRRFWSNIKECHAIHTPVIIIGSDFTEFKSKNFLLAIHDYCSRLQNDKNNVEIETYSTCQFSICIQQISYYYYCIFIR